MTSLAKQKRQPNMTLCRRQLTIHLILQLIQQLII